MEEIKRCTLVVRIFLNVAACLRLIRALAVEMRENWIEAMQHLNIEPLLEQKKKALWRMGDAGRKISPLLTKGRALSRPPLPRIPYPLKTGPATQPIYRT